MGSADLFAQANRLRAEASTIRRQAAELAQACTELADSPGSTVNLAERKIWGGPKANTMQQHLTSLAQTLRFHADQSLGECDDLVREAQRLEEQAEQVDAEGRRWAHAEAEAEAARLRQAAQIAQANAARASAATAAGSASTTAASGASNTVAESSTTTNSKPALIFAPIETTTVAATASASSQTDASNDDGGP